MKFEILKTENGFVYEIYNNDFLIYRQEFEAGLEGFVYFSQERALELAETYIESYHNPIPEVIDSRSDLEKKIDELQADNAALMLAITELYEQLAGGS